MSTESLSLLTSVIAAVISLYAVYFARKAFEANIIASKNAALIAQAGANEVRLHNFPKLFDLYGIDETSLRNDGLEPDELLYILSDLRQGEVFHRMDNYKDTGTMITHYRDAFLNNKKVQTAFNKYIYQRLMSDSPYIEAIKKYIDNNPA